MTKSCFLTRVSKLNGFQLKTRKISADGVTIYIYCIYCYIKNIYFNLNELLHVNSLNMTNRSENKTYNLKVYDLDL